MNLGWGDRNSQSEANEKPFNLSISQKSIWRIKSERHLAREKFIWGHSNYSGYWGLETNCQNTLTGKKQWADVAVQRFTLCSHAGVYSHLSQNALRCSSSFVAGRKDGSCKTSNLVIKKKIYKSSGSCSWSLIQMCICISILTSFLPSHFLCEKNLQILIDHPFLIFVA